MDDKNSGEGLKRVIGIPSLAATVINNTLGAGIYILPATVSLALGAAGILDYFFCAVVLVLIMLCYMEVGSKVTTSGGSYIYVEKAFGPLAGFIVNWLFFFGFGILGSAALMNALADSLAVIIPVFTHDWARIILYLILLGGVALVNVRGAKESVRVLEFITFFKVVPLVGIIIFGISHIKMANLSWEHLPPVKTFGDTALILFFAFVGFETSLGVSGEIKDPKRTIPLGITIGGLTVFVIYIIIQCVTQGVLGGNMGAFKAAPLAAVAQTIIGPAGVTILIAAAAISTFGNVSGDVLTTPRLLFAGARDGLFPAPLGRVHKKFATPYIAVLVYAGLIFFFSSIGGFEKLAVLSTGSLMIVYLGVILAMIKFRSVGPVTGVEKTFKVPGGLIIPVLAIAAIVGLLSSLKKDEMIGTSIFIAVVCVIYFAMQWIKQRIENKPVKP